MLQMTSTALTYIIITFQFGNSSNGNNGNDAVNKCNCSASQ